MTILRKTVLFKNKLIVCYLSKWINQFLYNYKYFISQAFEPVFCVRVVHVLCKYEIYIYCFCVAVSLKTKSIVLVFNKSLLCCLHGMGSEEVIHDNSSLRCSVLCYR